MIGNVITEQQQKIFERILTARDIAEVSQKTGVGTTTLGGLKYGYKTITETNIQGLIGLVAKANEKINNSIVFFEKAKKDIEQFQDEVNRVGKELLEQ